MATFTLIANDLAKAEKALEKIGADDVQDSSVIMVEMANKVGALQRISKLIADAGINIYYFYSTTSSGKTATCVIKTADTRGLSRFCRRHRRYITQFPETFHAALQSKFFPENSLDSASPFDYYKKYQIVTLSCLNI